MPLRDGDSPDIISENIRELIAAGHEPDQAAAIAYAHAKRRRVTRADEVPSHVISLARAHAIALKQRTKGGHFVRGHGVRSRVPKAMPPDAIEAGFAAAIKRVLKTPREEIAKLMHELSSTLAHRTDSADATPPANATDGSSPIVARRNVAGFPVAIENAAGSKRTWIDSDGSRGWTLMRWDYGYIIGAIGADGEDVDVYIGPVATPEWVFVIHQRSEADDFKSYDEDKVMLGWPSADAAKAAYLAQYDDPHFFGGMSVFTLDEFASKLRAIDGDKLTHADAWSDEAREAALEARRANVRKLEAGETAHLSVSHGVQDNGREAGHHATITPGIHAGTGNARYEVRVVATRNGKMAGGRATAPVFGARTASDAHDYAEKTIHQEGERVHKKFGPGEDRVVGTSSISSHARKDADDFSSADRARLRAALDRARREMEYELTTNKLSNIATETASNLSTFNAAQFSRQVRAAIGTDISLRDPKLSGLIDEFVHQNVSLIRSLGNRSLDDVEKAIMNGVASGDSFRGIQDDVQERYGISDRHAQLIARDQVGKLNGQITRARHEELGVSKYTWRDSGDDKVRPSHHRLDGRVFSYAKPPMVDGRRQNPGEPICCRCTPEPVFDDVKSAIAQQQANALTDLRGPTPSVSHSAKSRRKRSR